MLALSAMTAGVSGDENGGEILSVESWDAEDELLEENMLDDYNQLLIHK
jgi:hypothetical protein